MRGVCGELTEGDGDREAGKAPGMSRVRGELGRMVDLVLGFALSGVVEGAIFSSEGGSGGSGGGGEGGGWGIDVPAASGTDMDEGKPGSW